MDSRFQRRQGAERNTIPAKAFWLRGAVALCAVAVAGGLAQANDLIVRYDQSQLLRLPRSISQVIIGNPSIADASVQGSNLIVVTGKTFGVTNIIALDKQGNVIQDQRVIVQRDDVRMVNLHKGIHEFYGDRGWVWQHCRA